MINILEVRDNITRLAILGIPKFSDCMGCFTESRLCDTRYRIDFDLSFVFFQNNSLT